MSKIISNACTKCGGTYEKRGDELVCMACGYSPDNKPFPDVVAEIAKKKPIPRGPTLQSPVNLTEEERVAIVNEAQERGWYIVASERRITPNTLYNWRDNLKLYGFTRIKGQRLSQLETPRLHPMLANLLKELPPLDSKPDEALLNAFARAFSGILTIIYLKEENSEPKRD